MLSKLARKPIALGVAAVVIVALAFGLFWFQPWKLWTTNTVDEELPVAAAPSDSAATASDGTTPDGPSTADDPTIAHLLAEGEFITHEHETTGTAQLFRQPDGKVVLALAGLKTSDGPDLRVWITDQAVEKDAWDVFDDGYYVELGELKGNKGDQLYEVPEGTDLTKITSVTVWCKRFSVSFGAALLAWSEADETS
ncbi:DM13 domain-containing protein [Phytomonospora sp. NPDC050363]|uniref:DM13 domain-containing protein n=1 Tax=Phytomonospora sp. NPDC050363 TaxID=3155642 RepID=UPI0033F8949D